MIMNKKKAFAKRRDSYMLSWAKRDFHKYKYVHANKFSIGGLRRVYISNIVN